MKKWRSAKGSEYVKKETASNLEAVSFLKWQWLLKFYSLTCFWDMQTIAKLGSRQS